MPSGVPSTTVSPTGCGAGSNIETYDFEDDSVGLNLLGTGNNGGNPRRPWRYDPSTACNGTSALTAGGTKADARGGVDSETILSIVIVVPAGASSMKFFYSHLPMDYIFEVILNGDPPGQTISECSLSRLCRL